MLPRICRASIAAARRLSTKTAVVAAPAQETVLGEGGKTSGNKLSNASTGRDTLGRRFFALVYAKRSAVVALRKWKEEGHVVRKYELNRIVRELRKLKRYKHALEVCEWMRIQEDMKLVPGDYAVHLDLVAKIRGLNSAEKFFEDLPEKMRDPATCSALLHTYVQHKESDKAEALMEKMSECGFLKSPLPFNHMLSLYVSTGQLEKVPEIVKKLKMTTTPDAVTYNLLLAVCASQNIIETAEKVFLEQRQAKIEPDWMTYSTLTSIYIKNSLREKAESALKEMEKRVSRKVRVAYASLISLHTGLENKSENLKKRRNCTTSGSLFPLPRTQEFRQRHQTDRLGKGYRCNAGREPSCCLDHRGFDQKVQYHLSLGYLRQRQVDKVLDCFKKAVSSVRKWDPDEKLVKEVSSIVEEFGNVEGAEQLLVILRRAGYVNTETYNSLLRTYAKAGKMPLIVAERMKKDNVEIDEETKRLLQLTSKMHVSEIPLWFLRTYRGSVP
ncbi:UNVERIFIED_CONTAM: Pentatricopeptide repeat-containing protein, mitochondrial [Sesamum radiatum]|uniref:Pentatricopeptide repeat-containing protein, mitochondrial n=1 Tax=Sesamum radiatum TaxID=300843 RepID=A0AAW2UUK4_SESRA